MAETAFRPAIEGIKHVKSENGELLTKPFLDVCKVILPVLGKFGNMMSMVKNDLNTTISKLESTYDSDQTRFNYLFNLIQAEVEMKTAKKSSSCTNGLLWLTRIMDFLVELFRNLVEHHDWSTSKACFDSYDKTLKKHHNWIDSSTFAVGVKLAPKRKKFMEVLGNNDELYGDIEKFYTLLSPILADIHKFLISVNMDNLRI